MFLPPVNSRPTNTGEQGLSKREKERERSDGRDSLLLCSRLTLFLPMFSVCSRICTNNSPELLVLILSILISCCWMSNCRTRALVYTGIAWTGIRLEVLPLDLVMRNNRNQKTCFILSRKELVLLLYLFTAYEAIIYDTYI